MSSLHTNCDRGRWSKSATATLEGGRLHNRLCDCMERCVHLHRMGYVEATGAPPTTSPPSLAERCQGYFSCFVTR
jgi:hypothetical protein